MLSAKSLAYTSSSGERRELALCVASHSRTWTTCCSIWEGVCVCWGGGGGGGGVERGAEEKKKESGEGRREIEGEGKQGRWGGGKERVRGRKSEVLSTHSRLKGKLNQAKNKGKGTT